MEATKIMGRLHCFKWARISGMIKFYLTPGSKVQILKFYAHYLKLATEHHSRAPAGNGLGGEQAPQSALATLMRRSKATPQLRGF